MHDEYSQRKRLDFVQIQNYTGASHSIQLYHFCFWRNRFFFRSEYRNIRQTVITYGELFLLLVAVDDDKIEIRRGIYSFLRNRCFKLSALSLEHVYRLEI